MDESDKSDGILVNFLVCLVLFIYGCGPNLIISTILLIVRSVQSYLMHKKVNKLKNDITLKDDERRELSKYENKLIDFDKSNFSIAISIIPFAGPIVAYYRK